MTEDLTRGSGEQTEFLTVDTIETTAADGAAALSGSEGAAFLSGQATTAVNPPPAGQTVVYQPQAGDRFQLNANPADVRIQVEGNNVVLAFDLDGDGTPDSRALFENLVEVAQGDNPPVIEIGGQAIAANVLIGGALALAGEEATVETAAGAGALGGGGSTYDDDLGDVIALLVAQGIIPPTFLQFRLIERIDPTPDPAEGELTVSFETTIDGRTFGGGFEDGQPFQNWCKSAVYPMQIVVKFDPNDNEELKELKISGFPKGSVILLGGDDPQDPNVQIIDVSTDGFTLTLKLSSGHFVFNGTEWVIKGGLFMLPPPDSDLDIKFHFEATIEDPDSGAEAQLTLDKTAIIDAVADKPAAWFSGKGVYQVDGPELETMDFGYGSPKWNDGYYQENGLKLIAWGCDEFDIANFTGPGGIGWGERELKFQDGDLENSYLLKPCEPGECLNLLSIDIQACTTTDLVFISDVGGVFVIPAGSEPGTYYFPDGFQNVEKVWFYGEEGEGYNFSYIDNIKFSLACDCEPKEFKVCYLEDNARPDDCRDGCLTDGKPEYAAGVSFKVTDKDGSEGITKIVIELCDKVENNGQLHAPWLPDGNDVLDIEQLGPYGDSTTYLSIGNDKVTEGEVFCLWAVVFNATDGEIQGIGAGEFGWAKVEAVAHFYGGKLALDFDQDGNEGLHIQSVSLTGGQLLEVNLPQHMDDDFILKATVKVEENPSDEELVEWNNTSYQTTELEVTIKAVADGAEISFKDYTKHKECERYDVHLKNGGYAATWGEDITVTAFDAYGNPAKVYYNWQDGIGVDSNTDGGSGGRFDELNYVGYGKSEGLCFEFDSPVTDAKFTLNDFFKSEPGVGDEQGEWTAYLNGQVVGSDCFTADRFDGDFELTLPDDLIFDKIVFTAKNGTADDNNGHGGNDSSDYYVKSVCYEELLPGLCYFEETTTQGECCEEIPLLKLVWAEDAEGNPNEHGPNCDEEHLIVPVQFKADLIDQDGSESVTEVKLTLCDVDCNAQWVNKWGHEIEQGDWIQFANGFLGKVVYIDGDELCLTFDCDPTANNGENFCLDGEIGVKLPIDDSNDFKIKIGVTTSETHDDNIGAGDESCTSEAIIDVEIHGVVGPAKTSFGDYAEYRECHRGDVCIDPQDSSKALWGDDITVKVYDQFGNPATVVDGPNGIGIDSPNDGGVGGRFNEINYVGYGKSESMELCFDFPVTDAKFELSAFYKHESGVGNEQGKWVAYLHGEEVGEGIFTADSYSGDFELDLGHITFDKIVFKAIPGSFDFPGGDSSDYYIEKVCYEKPLPGLCEVSTTEKWVDGKKVEALKLVWAEDGTGNPNEHGPNDQEDGLCIPMQFKAETQDDDGSQKSEAITKICLEENGEGEFVVKGEADGKVEIWAKNQLGEWFQAVATVTHLDGKLILEFEDIGGVPQLVNEVDLSNAVDIKLPVDDSNDFCVEIETTTREYDDDNFDKDGNWIGYNPDADVKVAETTVKDYIDIEIHGVVGPAATEFGYDECKVCTDDIALSHDGKVGLWGDDIKVLAFDQWGNPAKIAETGQGIGVDSSNDGGVGGVYDQINYVDDDDKSESLVLDFCGKVTCVKIDISEFYKNEHDVGNERGKYELYLNGQKVGEGSFEANSGEGDYCLDLGEACFDKIVFKAIKGTNDDGSDASSDYFVKEVCYKPVYEGLCDVNPEGACLVDCPVEVTAQILGGDLDPDFGDPWAFGLYLQTGDLGDVADKIIVVHLPPGFSVPEGHGTHGLYDPEANTVTFTSGQLGGGLNWTIQLNGPYAPTTDDFLIESFKSVPAFQTTWAEDGTADVYDHGDNDCEDPLCIPVEFKAKTQDNDGNQQSEAITKIVLHEDGDGHFVVEGLNNGKIQILAIGLDGEVIDAIAHVTQVNGTLCLEFKDINGKPQLIQEVDLSCAVKLVHPIDDSTDYCVKIETTTTEYDDDSFYSNGEWKGYVGDDEVKVEEFTKTDMLSIEIKGVVGPAIVELHSERVFLEDGGEVCGEPVCVDSRDVRYNDGTWTWGDDIVLVAKDENGNPNNADPEATQFGVGVDSGNDGGTGGRFDEINHTGQGSQKSESLELCFDCPVTNAKFELSKFFSGEGGVGNEQGKWVAYLDGCEVGSDSFTAYSGEGDFCLDLDGLIFDKIVFSGLPGTNDDGIGDGNNDSSDYYIEKVTYQKIECCQDPDLDALKVPVSVCVTTQDTDGSEGVMAINLVIDCVETNEPFTFVDQYCEPICEGDLFDAKGYVYDDYGNLVGETCIQLEACEIPGGWLLKVVPDDNTPFDGWDKIVLDEGELFINPPHNFNGKFELTVSGHIKEFDDDLDGGKEGHDTLVTEETVTYKIVPINDAPIADPVKTTADDVPQELDEKLGDVVLFKCLEVGGADDIGGALDGDLTVHEPGDTGDPADLGGEDVETAEANLTFVIQTLPDLGTLYIDRDGDDPTGGDWEVAAIDSKFDTGDKLYWLANQGDLDDGQVEPGPGSVTFNYKVIDDGTGGCDDCESDPAPVQICYVAPEDNLAPDAIDDEGCVDEAKLVDTNVMIIFDRTGSMDDDPGVAGFDHRIDLARAAVEELLNAYDVFGDVKVLIVDFAGGSADNSGWVSIEDALTYLAGLTPSGNTDYSAALDEAEAAWPGAGKIGGAQNVSYFLSDGARNAGDNVGTDENNSRTDWENFVIANDITSYAVGVGGGLSDPDPDLEAVAVPSVGNATGDAIYVSDESQLIDTLVGTVNASVTGNVLSGVSNDGLPGNDSAPDVLGDTPTTITTLEVDVEGFGLVTFTYDGAQITNDSGGGIPTVAGSLLTATTALGGSLSFDFSNGDYEYVAKLGTGGETETFDYTIEDDDGETDTATLTICINDVDIPPLALNDTVLTNQVDGSPIEIPAWALLKNDIDFDSELEIDSAQNPTPAGSSVLNGLPNVTYTPAWAAAEFVGDGEVNWSGDPQTLNRNDFRLQSSTLGLAVATLSVVGGQMDTGTDVDTFTVDVKAGETVTVDIDGISINSVLTVTGPGVNSGAVNPGGNDASYTFVAPSDGTYTISVGSATNNDTGSYRVDVTLEVPLNGGFEYTAAEDGPVVPQTDDAAVSVTGVNSPVIEGSDADEILIGSYEGDPLTILFEANGSGNDGTTESDDDFFRINFSSGGPGQYIHQIVIDLQGGTDGNASWDPEGPGSNDFGPILQNLVGLTSGDISFAVSGSEDQILTITFAENSFGVGDSFRFGLDTDNVSNPGDTENDGDSFGASGVTIQVIMESFAEGGAAFVNTGGDNGVSQATVNLAGGDVLIGNGGDDVLIGGLGDDVLSGGNGSDVFVILGDSTGPNQGIKTITDFDGSDVLRLENVVDHDLDSDIDINDVVSSFNKVGNEVTATVHNGTVLVITDVDNVLNSLNDLQNFSEFTF